MPDGPGPASVVLLTVPHDLAGKRLDLVLDALVDGVSRARLQKLVRKGMVRVEGQRVLRSNVRVASGQRVAVDFTAGGAEGAPEIEVLHVDDDVVGIDKPPGLVVHPADRVQGDTVCAQMTARFGRFSVVPGDHRPGVVHRLDRWTSGVLVLARSDRAAVALRRQFRNREVHKRYLAIVHGTPEWESTVLEGRLGSHPTHPDLQVVDPPGVSRDAITAVTVRERFGHASLVECRPRTGRRHQIRVQLAAAGHPVVGDELYRPHAETAVSPATFAMRRQALHALELIVRHPADGAQLRLHAGLPADMEELLATLRAGD